MFVKSPTLSEVPRSLSASATFGSGLLAPGLGWSVLSSSFLSEFAGGGGGAGGHGGSVSPRRSTRVSGLAG